MTCIVVLGSCILFEFNTLKSNEKTGEEELLYKASATLYIEQSGYEGDSYTEYIKIIISNYNTFFNSNDVISKLNEKLELEEKNIFNKANEYISATQIELSSGFKIQVVAYDKERAEIIIEYLLNNINVMPDSVKGYLNADLVGEVEVNTYYNIVDKSDEVSYIQLFIKTVKQFILSFTGVACLIISISLAIFIIFFILILDKRICTTDEVEKIFGIKRLGYLDQHKDNKELYTLINYTCKKNTIDKLVFIISDDNSGTYDEDYLSENLKKEIMVNNSIENISNLVNEEIIENGLGNYILLVRTKKTKINQIEKTINLIQKYDGKIEGYICYTL